MEKIDAMKNLVENIKALSWSVEVLIKSMEEVGEKEIPLETVREVLSQKIKNGFTENVKQLIASYNCEKLSDIDKKFYKEIIKKAEEFHNDR